MVNPMGKLKQRIQVGSASLDPRRLNFLTEYLKDFSPRRAAEASGFSPEYGYQITQEEAFQEALSYVLMEKLDSSCIDAEWVLMELVDNHGIARQQGNIGASNTALGIIAKHKLVDAMAREKVDMEVTTSKELVERLLRGRRRAAGVESDPGGESVNFM